MDTRTYGNIQTVKDGEYPFYEQEDSEDEKEIVPPLYSDNAQTLANYRLTPYSAPSPNTIVPTGPDGLLPAAIIPAIPATTIYSRDGLHTFSLVVEANGALSVDQLT